MTRKWMIETDKAMNTYSVPGYGADGSNATYREIAVGLSADDVGVLRSTLERCQSELERATAKFNILEMPTDAADATVTFELARNALRVLPKREPTLLEAAKAVGEFYDGNQDTSPLCAAINALRAAIDREEARKA